MQVERSASMPGGGGDSNIKTVGMHVENFEIDRLRETNLGVARPFFNP